MSLGRNQSCDGIEIGELLCIDVGIAISLSKPVNPFSKPDWEGTGVEPNAKVKEADALDAAEKMALNKPEKH